MAGEPNAAVRELWGSKVRRSFQQVDGKARAAALLEQMVPVQVDGKERHMVYPAKDERVMRVVRKIVRGLCACHELGAPVPDSAVTADVLRFAIPLEVIEELPHFDFEPDIFAYRFTPIESDLLISVWLLTFYERTTFICSVAPFAGCNKSNAWRATRPADEA